MTVLGVIVAALLVPASLVPEWQAQGPLFLALVYLMVAAPFLVALFFARRTGPLLVIDEDAITFHGLFRSGPRVARRDQLVSVVEDFTLMPKNQRALSSLGSSYRYPGSQRYLVLHRGSDGGRIPISGHRPEIDRLRQEYPDLSGFSFRMESFGAMAEKDLLATLTEWGVPFHNDASLPAGTQR